MEYIKVRASASRGSSPKKRARAAEGVDGVGDGDGKQGRERVKRKRRVDDGSAQDISPITPEDSQNVDTHGVLAETYSSSINCNASLAPETGGDLSLKRFHQLKEEAIGSKKERSRSNGQLIIILPSFQQVGKIFRRGRRWR
jgi:hypothetical protein